MQTRSVMAVQNSRTAGQGVRSVPQGLRLPAPACARPSRAASFLSGAAALRSTWTARLGCTSRPHCSLAVSAAAAPVAPASPVVLEKAHGFTLMRQEFVAEYDSTVLLYKHDKTGAELISVLCADENKTFGAVFRTPVDDSTGIPHILEHSVLCGSRKYPIKEPFVELMKGSLNTFLNAFTYPDRTCYPVASTNTKDFYNLVDVYLDAVFHPNCVRDRQIFEQEGWHHELEQTEEDITYKGVVFNEMKGVYSSPDSVYYRVVQNELFPSNTYRHDSGGDPEAIPHLTYEAFQGFHQRYYHPSNAKLWFYGDDCPEERLRLLNAFLDEFSAAPVDSAVAVQPLMTEPRKVTKYYSAGEEEEEGAGKAFVGLNWVLTSEELSVETELGLAFLDYLMLGTNAAPLKKALNDSGLGAAVIGGGMDDELRQPTFSLGLKGVDPANADKVSELILTKLEELASTGFTSTAIEAAINTIEFSLRENNTGSFPRGLSLMLRAMGAWIYDRDPFQPIKWQNALETFKARIASGENVFEPLIRQYLLTNPHRVMVTLLPDPALGEAIEAKEKAKLQQLKEAATKEQLEAIISSTEALKTRQETPDAPEALTCMPSLKLSDIPSTITKVPTVVSKEGGSTVLRHDLFTNNVLYMEMALDVGGVPEGLLPLLPLFCRSLTQMGTSKFSFIELTEQLGRKTGGLSVYPFTSPVRGRSEPVAKVVVRCKAMGDKSADMIELVREILLTARLDDAERFKQMVNETKAGLEAGIIGSGHSFAMKRLSGQRSTAGWMSEAMGGLSYLEYIRGLAKRLEGDWEGVKADLEGIRKALLAKSGALVNLTGDERTLSRASGAVSDLLASLPDASPMAATWGSRLPKVNEALVVPTQVNYVGKAANLYEDAGYELHGSAYVIDKYLGTSWLWDRVRVVGGAYGGFCSFDPLTGMFSYLSYRDPNLMDTLAVYDGTVDFLRGLDMNQDELSKAIIGTIGDIDSYQLPDAKGYSAMSRYLLGISDEERQMRRDQILATSVNDFRKFADALEAVRNPETARVVAVTSADKAKAVNEQQPGFWEVRKVL